MMCHVGGVVAGGGGWSGRTGGGAWVSVRSRSSAVVMAQMARAAITSTAWRAIAVYSRAWHWSRPKQSLKSVTHCRTTPTGFQQK